MKKDFEKNISLMYGTISLILVFFSYFFDLINEKIFTYSLLVFLVVLFGFPHGALDSLVAKRNKIFNSFLGFIFFNLAYLTTAITIFFIWNNFPLSSLIIFLIISAWHFSEDWNKKLDLFKRLVLGMTIVNLPAFFYSSEIYLIYNMLVKNNDAGVTNLLNFQEYLMYLLFALLFFVFISNLKSKILLIQIIIIFFSSILLHPIYYFISYFCFFHSIKNFRETLVELEEKKNKTILFLIINTLLTIIFGFVLFFYFMEGPLIKKLTGITFIGLASLTVPHMLLRLLINNKKILPFQKSWH